MTKEALKLALEALEIQLENSNGEKKYADAIAEIKALAQPVQEPVAWRDMVVVSLVREGVNKHKARELADHFATPPLPVQEDYECVTRQSAENAIDYMSSYNGRGRDVDAQAMLVSAPMPVQPASGEVTDARMVLIQSLVASKGWNHGYAAAFVDDWFHDRLAATTNTAPMPVKRQPLTDVELAGIYMTTTGLDFYRKFARAIEAAHNIGAKP